MDKLKDKAAAVQEITEDTWPKYVKVKEPWEEQSADILTLPEIPGHPEYVRRYINPDFRFGKKGRTGGWQPDDPKHMEKVGDLVSAFQPKDQIEKRNAYFRHKHERLMAQEEENRRLIQERMARENKSKHQQWSGFKFGQA